MGAQSRLRDDGPAWSHTPQLCPIPTDASPSPSPGHCNSGHLCLVLCKEQPPTRSRPLGHPTKLIVFEEGEVEQEVGGAGTIRVVVLCGRVQEVPQGLPTMPSSTYVSF